MPSLPYPSLTRKLLAMLLLASAALWLVACQKPLPPGTVGGAMPELPVRAVSGGTSTFRGRQGKLLVVNFWAIWCPPCRAEMPSLQKLSDALKGRNVQIIGIAVEDDPHLVDEFLRATGVRFPTWLVSQQTVEQELKMFDYPLTLIIDTDGQILARIVGGLDWHHESILPLLETMAAGQALEPGQLAATIQKARSSLFARFQAQNR